MPPGPPCLLMAAVIPGRASLSSNDSEADPGTPRTVRLSPRGRTSESVQS